MFGAGTRLAGLSSIHPAAGDCPGSARGAQRRARGRAPPARGTAHGAPLQLTARPCLRHRAGEQHICHLQLLTTSRHCGRHKRKTPQPLPLVSHCSQHYQGISAVYLVLSLKKKLSYLKRSIRKRGSFEEIGCGFFACHIVCDFFSSLYVTFFPLSMSEFAYAGHKRVSEQQANKKSLRNLSAKKPLFTGEIPAIVK